MLGIFATSFLCIALHSTELGQVAVLQRRPNPEYRVHVADPEGATLPVGTELEVKVAWTFTGDPQDLFVPRIGFDPGFHNVCVQEDGAITFRPHWIALDSHTGFLHIRPKLQAEDTLRRRVLVAWRPDAPDHDLGQVKFERERLLASGEVLDDQGRAIPEYAFTISIEHLGGGRGSDSLRLGTRMTQTTGRFAAYGWPNDGPWMIKAWYGVHGPFGERVSLELTREDVRVILPAVGHVQTKLQVPESFPVRVLEVSFRDLESGEVTRRTLVDRVQNTCLKVGRFHLELECSGEIVADLGAVEVAHAATNEVLVELPKDLRVLRIEVRDAEGQPIHGARATRLCVESQPTVSYNSQARAILVATTAPRIDLRIEAHGFVSELREDVTGDSVIVLSREQP